MKSTSSAAPAEQSVQQFLAEFTAPDPRFSPVPLWWWSGEPLRIEKLRWQMDRMCEMGIRNVCVINLAPNGTLFGCDPDDPPFLSEQWWAIFQEVCVHAKLIGMFMWFYDPIGFSGASYQAELVARHPEFHAQQLKSTFIERTGTLAVEAPRLGIPIAAYVTPLNSPRDARYLDRIDHRIKVHVTQTSRLRLVYVVRQGYDYLNALACDKLLDTVHREFERRLPEFLGSTIVGSFKTSCPTSQPGVTPLHKNLKAPSITCLKKAASKPGEPATVITSCAQRWPSRHCSNPSSTGTPHAACNAASINKAPQERRASSVRFRNTPTTSRPIAGTQSPYQISTVTASCTVQSPSSMTARAYGSEVFIRPAGAAPSPTHSTGCCPICSPASPSSIRMRCTIQLAWAGGNGLLPAPVGGSHTPGTIPVLPTWSPASASSSPRDVTRQPSASSFPLPPFRPR